MNTDMKDEVGQSNNEIHKEMKLLAKNSFYSFLYIYGSFFGLLFASFFKARLISQDSWNILVLSNSYISIVLLILTFLPPGLENTLNYYIPRFLSLNQKHRLKILVKRAILIKILFVILIFIISFSIFFFFSNLFAITLTLVNVKLLFILSPLIIISSINLILISINQSFNKFKTNFFLMVIQNLINLGSLAFYFFFVHTITIEIIALIIVISSLIPFILNLTIIIRRILIIKPKNKKSSLFKEDLQKLLKFGSPIRFGKFLTDFWGQFQIQAIGLYDKDMVIGFHISKQYLSVSLNATSSLLSPLTISFSKLNAKKTFNEIGKIYNILLKYSLFLILFITGILYFCTDFFLSFFFGNSFLIFSDLVKVYLFSYIFLIFSGQFESLLLSKNKVKYIPIIRGIVLLIRLPFFLILLISFELIIAIIGLLIINIFYGVFIIILTIRIGRIKLNLRNIFFQYLAFFLTICFILILQSIGLNKLNYLMLSNLHILTFQNLNFLALGIFILVFLILTITFKIFIIEDITNLERLFNKNKKLHIITRKILKLLKRIIRK